MYQKLRKNIQSEFQFERVKGMPKILFIPLTFSIESRCFILRKKVSAGLKVDSSLQQECTPVGCVTSTAAAVSPATHAPSPPPAMHTPPAMHIPPPCMPPCHAHPPLPHMPPSPCTPPSPPCILPWTE